MVATGLADADAKSTGDADFDTAISPLIAERSPATGDTLKASDSPWDCASPFKMLEEAPLPNVDVDVDVDVESRPFLDSGSEPSGAKDIIRKSTISNPIRGMGARGISRCPIRPI